MQESFEDRQTETAEALQELFREIERNEQRKKEQAEKGFDGLTFFVYRTLLDAGVSEAEEVSKKIKACVCGEFELERGGARRSCEN